MASTVQDPTGVQIKLTSLQELILDSLQEEVTGKTRNKIMLELQKKTNRNIPRTTIYDSIAPLMIKHEIIKSENRKIKLRGRPSTFFMLTDKFFKLKKVEPIE